MVPSVFGGSPGPALKYKRALCTRRLLWVTFDFRANFPDIWANILEALTSGDGPCDWHLLPSAEAWAATKAVAQERSRSAEVLALLTEVEASAVEGTGQAFNHSGFLDFLGKPDWEKSSLGLGRM